MAIDTLSDEVAVRLFCSPTGCARSTDHFFNGQSLSELEGAERDGDDEVAEQERIAFEITVTFAMASLVYLAICLLQPQRPNAVI